MNVFKNVVAEISPEFASACEQRLLDHNVGADMYVMIEEKINRVFPSVSLSRKEDLNICLSGSWDELALVQSALKSWLNSRSASLEDLNFSPLTAMTQRYPDAVANNDMKSESVSPRKSPMDGITSGQVTCGTEDKTSENNAMKAGGDAQALLEKNTKNSSVGHDDEHDPGADMATKGESIKEESPQIRSKSGRIIKKKRLENFEMESGKPRRSKMSTDFVSSPSLTSLTHQPDDRNPVEAIVVEPQCQSEEMEALLSVISSLEESADKSEVSRSDEVKAEKTEVDETNDDNHQSDEIELFEDSFVTKQKRGGRRGEQLKEHFFKVEGEDSEKGKPSKQFACRHCDFKSAVCSNLKSHLLRNHMEKTFVCKECGKSYGLEKDLRRHMSAHKPRFDCGENGCTAVFAKKCALNRHLRKVHQMSKARKNLVCGECSFTSPNERMLEVHQIREHGDKNLSCNSCDKKFALQKDLECHLRTHTEQFYCDICGKLLRSQYALKKHVDNLHHKIPAKPSKSYLCNHCGFLCHNKTQYKVHMNREHLKVKPFKCSECDLAFFAQANLTLHKAVHSDNRSYMCNYCGKSFKQSQSLRIHKITHAEERPFNCETCKKSFTQRGALIRHQRIHTGERPYACKLCSSSFNDYSILRRHVLGVHKIDDHHLVRRNADDEKTKAILETVKSQIETNSEEGSPKKLARKRKFKEPMTEHDPKEQDNVKVEQENVESVLLTFGSATEEATEVAQNTEETYTEMHVLPEHLDKMSIILQAAQQSLITSSLPASNIASSSNESTLEVQAIEALAHMNQPIATETETIIQIPESSLLQQSFTIPVVHDGGGVSILCVDNKQFEQMQT